MSLPGFEERVISLEPDSCGAINLWETNKPGRVLETSGWELLRQVLDCLEAWLWRDHYSSPVLDGVKWSLRLSWGERHIECSGSNAWPAGFNIFLQALNRVAGNGLFDSIDTSSDLPRAASIAALARHGAARGLAQIEAILRDKSCEPALLHTAMKTLEAWGLDAIPALPDLLSLLPGTEGIFFSREAADCLEAIADAANEDNDCARASLTSHLPIIQSALRNPALDEEVSASLIHLIGVLEPTEQMIGSLVDALHHGRDRVMEAVLSVLGDMGPRARSAIPALLDVLAQKSSPSLGSRLTGLICSLDPEMASPALSVLLDQLRDERLEVRRQAVEGLRNLGPKALAAIPILIEMTGDRDEHLRFLSMDTLGAIGPEAAAAVPRLIHALHEDKYFIRWRAASALGEMGPRAQAAIPSLVQCLSASSDGELSKRISWTLKALLPSSGYSLDPLIEVLRSSSRMNRTAAARALSGLGEMASAAVPALTEALQAGDEWLRHEACMTLEAIGHMAGSAAPVLFSLLQDKEVHVRVAAASALGAILSEPPQEGLDLLCHVIAQCQKDDLAREDAVKALAHYGSLAIPGLVLALRDSHWLIRLLAARTLGGLGTAEPSTISALVTALRDPEESVKMDAAQALFRLGGDGLSEAFHTLERIVRKGRYPEDRARAVEIMGKLCPKAVDILKAALKDRDPDVRKSAEDALGQSHL